MVLHTCKTSFIKVILSEHNMYIILLLMFKLQYSSLYFTVFTSTDLELAIGFLNKTRSTVAFQ